MPRGDGSGPIGLGAMTGRSAGFCAGFQVPGYRNPFPIRGQRNAGRSHGLSRHICRASLIPGSIYLLYRLLEYRRRQRQK
ncbi:DUF5320 domain-containing protein [Mobilitalea sibirica]|uniref:DUF5320 domain-containing protein n=1 Tax=Mobilitalea sibirica TaxID=1462919 RepID=A0A8J7H9Z7_9FIRM|nr:DUF5320 domain-containing protein [Mobilitalea sibirica]MBH1939431.1 DUF5320 domain-containing protein [Mobilitalea sibirica]